MLKLEAVDSCSVINKSLAEALRQFYPLAGKLSQLIQHPDVHEVANIFLPFEPRDPGLLSMRLPLISVEVNVFDRGPWWRNCDWFVHLPQNN
ncbi:hypothetical protein C5167_029103 [Papaver somniferum]|nr:hypothetical protein C5167_029103 [Papaver somniferum]